MFLCSGNIFPGVNPTNDEIRTDQCSFNKASSTPPTWGEFIFAVPSILTRDHG